MQWQWQYRRLLQPLWQQVRKQHLFLAPVNTSQPTATCNHPLHPPLAPNYFPRSRSLTVIAFPGFHWVGDASAEGKVFSFVCFFLLVLSLWLIVKQPPVFQGKGHWNCSPHSGWYNPECGEQFPVVCLFLALCTAMPSLFHYFWRIYWLYFGLFAVSQAGLKLNQLQ